ncbi:TetR/AcrR family transcriptional regulator [Haladaptatus salinisoli]|uniref:TetR/AcrR family transcriptional regulator n=1 Tax=Haladaptatus salinisoli TaxID=2884876 RepID=UPI001D0A4FED|nr:TetR/AcrR family transcriptional regulator [Haladaptatus salinisoli]
MSSPEDRQERAGSAETRAAIMEATHRALCKHGYANLSIQKIADEFEMTTAVLHYHYDTKEKLLSAFLEYLLDNLVDEHTNQFDIEAIEDPHDRLLVIVDALLVVLVGIDNPDRPIERADDRPPLGGEELSMALLELRAQAGRNESFREQFTVNYDYAWDLMVATIEEGVEQGVFREVDPGQVATLLLATMLGGRAYHVSLTHDDVASTVRNALVDLILDDLLVARDD